MTTNEAEKFVQEIGCLKFRYATELSVYYTTLIPAVVDEKAYYYQFEFDFTPESEFTFFAYDSANQFLSDFKLVSIALLDNDRIEDVIYKNY